MQNGHFVHAQLEPVPPQTVVLYRSAIINVTILGPATANIGTQPKAPPAKAHRSQQHVIAVQPTITMVPMEQDRQKPIVMQPLLHHVHKTPVQHQTIAIV